MLSQTRKWFFCRGWINEKNISEYTESINAEMISAYTESTKNDFWVLSVDAETVYGTLSQQGNMAYLVLMAIVHIFLAKYISFAIWHPRV